MQEKQDHPIQFFTAVCKDWMLLLADDEVKKIIIEALQFRVSRGDVRVCAFVIMPNHMHLIWRIAPKLERAELQRDFLKFTARSILAYLHRHHPFLYDRSKVEAKDRMFQVWKRDSMSIDLFTDRFFQQKLDYIHANPLQPKWNLANTPSDYYYSSASFYEEGKTHFPFLVHYQDM